MDRLAAENELFERRGLFAWLPGFRVDLGADQGQVAVVVVEGTHDRGDGAPLRLERLGLAQAGKGSESTMAPDELVPVALAANCDGLQQAEALDVLGQRVQLDQLAAGIAGIRIDQLARQRDRFGRRGERQLVRVQQAAAVGVLSHGVGSILHRGGEPSRVARRPLGS
jgi:hypothetical protein